MDETIQQYMMAGVYALISFAIMIAVLQTLHHPMVISSLPELQDVSLPDVSLVKDKKIVIRVKDTRLKLNQEFDYLDYIDVEGIPQDMMKSITCIYGRVDTHTKGMYKVKYDLVYQNVHYQKETIFVVD